MGRHLFIKRAVLAVAAGLAVFFAAAPVRADWPTLAGNPQRTSSVVDEVRGDVSAVWYRPIQPYINNKTQVIAAAGKVFVSTAKGLYAFDANTGATAWVYATEMPLGHSPTYSNGRLYVGSFDRTIHAIDATTGARVAGWNPFLALGGFETNPLVANGRVYAGSRDGYFYCLDANTGALVWRFKTGAAIRNSAAIDSTNTIYFASEDLYGYALRDAGTTYQLVWKSQKMLGDTFSTYWPVVYRNFVIFSGGMGYLYTPPYGTGRQLPWDDKDDINADITVNTGTVAGDWPAGTVTMDASAIIRYYQNKPYRRRVFLLNRTDGSEYTFDSNGDGVPEYAPFTFSGITQSGPKYPPVIGNDGVLYTHMDTQATTAYWTPSGALVGWKVGTQYVSRVMDWGAKQQQAADEPMAFSVGGRLAYWNLCCDRETSSFDLSIPFNQANRYWYYWGYNGRFTKFPNYEPMYYLDDMDGWGVYGGTDGYYAKHGAQNPWVPYNGKVYRIMGNAIVAAAPGGTATAPLPIATTIAPTVTTPIPTQADLRAKLDEEIQKMIAAGHLKPGLFKSNIGDDTLAGNIPAAMDQGIFYFSSPGDTIWALVRALPYVSSATQTQLRSYIQSEMASFSIATYAYVGHVEGTSRQAAVVPPDYIAAFNNFPKQTTVVNNYPWYFPMMNFYAAWKYAVAFPGTASGLYSSMRSKITVPALVSDADFVSQLQALNAYIAGYRGFLELERLAGQPETASVRNEYNRLLALRLNNVSISLPFNNLNGRMKNFIMARHFLYLVPELAAEMRNANKVPQVQAAIDRINLVTPLWFIEGVDVTDREGTHNQLYDVATFNAQAWVLQTPYDSLVKYLDAPAFPVGDLLYMQNLISAIEAPAGGGSQQAPGAPTNVRIVR